MSAEPAGGDAEQPPTPVLTTDRQASPHRELGTVLAVVVAAAAGILLMTSLRWLSLDASRPAPFAAVRTVVKGRQEFPALAGLGVVALLVAVLAMVTGVWARRALGVLLIVVGGWCASYGVRGLSAPGRSRRLALLDGPATSTYRVVDVHLDPASAAITIVLALALALAGVALAARAGRWSTGLSAKYATPSEARKVDDPWRSLDRGEDPTDPDGYDRKQTA